MVREGGCRELDPFKGHRVCTATCCLHTAYPHVVDGLSDTDCESHGEQLTRCYRRDSNFNALFSTLSVSCCQVKFQIVMCRSCSNGRLTIDRLAELAFQFLALHTTHSLSHCQVVFQMRKVQGMLEDLDENLVVLDAKVGAGPIASCFKRENYGGEFREGVWRWGPRFGQIWDPEMEACNLGLQ